MYEDVAVVGQKNGKDADDADVGARASQSYHPRVAMAGLRVP